MCLLFLSMERPRIRILKSFPGNFYVQPQLKNNHKTPEHWRVVILNDNYDNYYLKKKYKLKLFIS